jgi:hypothetical protein
VKIFCRDTEMLRGRERDWERGRESLRKWEQCLWQNWCALVRGGAKRRAKERGGTAEKRKQTLSEGNSSWERYGTGGEGSV